MNKTKLKALWQRYRQVAENFFSLSVLNALNVLLPLVTLPYILRVVGSANYGIYNYVYVVLQYVILFAAYGFYFSATKQISECRDDQTAVRRIYNAVTACKTLIAVVVTVALLAVSRFVFRDAAAPRMFLYGLGMVVGDILTPTWLFQGMEKMKFMTIVNASSKVLFTLLVFLVVRTEDDFVWLILLNSCGYLLAGFLSVWLARRQFHMRFARTTWAEVKGQLRDGFAVFGSTFGMNLYRNVNVIILKQFVPNEAVGLYSAAEKVIKGFQSLISPAAQALFPHLSYRFRGQSVQHNLTLLRRIVWPFAGVVLAGAVGVFAFAPLISDILCGPAFAACVPLIRIMTLVIFFGELNYLIGIVGLINMNRQRHFFCSVLATGLFCVLFLLLTVRNYGATAAAAAMSLSEMLLTALCLLGFRKLRKQS